MNTKELSIGPNISSHDEQHKLKKALELLNKANNLKLVMFFKGRNIIHQDIGKQKLMSFINLLEESKLGKLNSEPKLAGKRLIAIINFRKIMT